MTLFKESHDVFSWNYEEMYGMEHFIIIHETKSSPYAKPDRQKPRPVHLRKNATIKES